MKRPSGNRTAVLIATVLVMLACAFAVGGASAGSRLNCACRVEQEAPPGSAPGYRGVFGWLVYVEHLTDISGSMRGLSAAVIDIERAVVTGAAPNSVKRFGSEVVAADPASAPTFTEGNTYLQGVIDHVRQGIGAHPSSVYIIGTDALDSPGPSQPACGSFLDELAGIDTGEARIYIIRVCADPLFTNPVVTNISGGAVLVQVDSSAVARAADTVLQMVNKDINRLSTSVINAMTTVKFMTPSRRDYPHAWGAAWTVCVLLVVAAAAWLLFRRLRRRAGAKGRTRSRKGTLQYNLQTPEAAVSGELVLKAPSHFWMGPEAEPPVPQLPIDRLLVMVREKGGLFVQPTDVCEVEGNGKGNVTVKTHWWKLDLRYTPLKDGRRVIRHA